MKIDLSRPDHLCWAAIPLIILISIFTGNNAFDVHLHATYFEIRFVYLLLITAVLIAISGFVYQNIIKSKGRGIMPLIKGHLWYTMLLAALLFAASALAGNATERNSGIIEEYRYSFIVVLSAGALTILLIQLLFFISFMVSFTKGSRSQ